MKLFPAILGLVAICSSAGALPAPRTAQAAREQKFFYHYEWTRGAVVTAREWKRGTEIHHPRRHGLPAAASGDEWREIDRNYVLVGSSTHAIVRVVAGPHPTMPGRSGGEP